MKGARAQRSCLIFVVGVHVCKHCVGYLRVFSILHPGFSEFITPGLASSFILDGTIARTRLVGIHHFEVGQFIALERTTRNGIL